MGLCKSKSASSASLSRTPMATNVDKVGNNIQQQVEKPSVTAGLDELAITDVPIMINRDVSASINENFYDALEQDENQFPLTMSHRHQFVEYEGLDGKLKEAIESNTKSRFSNAFTDPPAHLFQVRGPDYLKNGKGGKNMKELKCPSKESPYELIGVNMFRSHVRVKHASEEIGVVRRFFESYPADKEDALFPQFLVINWQLSPLFKKEYFTMQHIFRLRPDSDAMQDSGLVSAFSRFKKGSEAERNSQFKYMFRVVDAPSAVKNAISYLGGERPVLIGKSLTTRYFQGKNHLEINMDVSSSRIASAINGIVLKNVETVVMDLSWLLEGQRDEELPERVLCKIRWIWNNADDVIVNLDNDGEIIVDGTHP